MKMTLEEAVIHHAKRLIKARGAYRLARKESAEASTKYAQHIGFKSKQHIFMDEEPSETKKLEAMFPYFKEGDYGVTYDSVYDYLSQNWQKERDAFFDDNFAEVITSSKSEVKNVMQQLRKAVLKLDSGVLK